MIVGEVRLRQFKYENYTHYTINHIESFVGYDNLKYENYTHNTVNHKEHFVNPRTGVHTQNIERLWRDMKSVLPRYGTSKAHYKHYLSEFMFKRHYPLEKRIDTFFDIMARFYSPY